MLPNSRSSRDKVGLHRERRRAQGLRPVQIWVPDVRARSFVAAARKQSRRSPPASIQVQINISSTRFLKRLLPEARRAMDSIGRCELYEASTSGHRAGGPVRPNKLDHALRIHDRSDGCAIAAHAHRTDRSQRIEEPFTTQHLGRDTVQIGARVPVGSPRATSRALSSSRNLSVANSPT
jgi:antidote-toxin recognition MazE-like antitoxin